MCLCNANEVYLNLDNPNKPLQANFADLLYWIAQLLLFVKPLLITAGIALHIHTYTIFSFFMLRMYV